MNPKLLLLAVVSVAVAAIAALLLLYGGNDDGDTAVTTQGDTSTVPGTIVTAATPTPTATLGVAPEVTPTASPTPELSPEEQARGLTLVEAPAGMLQFTADGPYVVPGDALGVFYLDIETQRIEGWYDLIAGQSPTMPRAFSGENRFTLFERREQVFRGGIIYPQGEYLGDRESRRTYRWSGDAELVYEEQGFNSSEIAAEGSLVLFRVPVSDGEDWFSLLDIDTGEVRATFQAEGDWALISDDGKRIALAGEDVYVVDVDSGSVDRIDQRAIATVDREGSIALIATDDGFLFVSSPAKPDGNGIALRYTWEGDLVSRFQAAKLFPSPDGALIAEANPIVAADEGRHAPWWSFEARSTSDESPQFRVVGVTPDYGEWAAGNRWLADGSGIVVAGPDNQVVLARRDGNFDEFVGVPSPDDAGVFAVNGGAVDADGDPIIVITFQGGIRDFVSPWGEAGDEVRILIPHGGHDGPGRPVTIVEAYVEQAPYDDAPLLQLSEVAVAFGLLNLYDQAGGKTVVGKVAAPHTVTVHELVLRCTGDFDRYGTVTDCPAADSTAQNDFYALVRGVSIENDPLLIGYWARVTAQDGQEGWLLLQARPQGI